MPWGKMDDKFHRNRKVRALRRMGSKGRDALATWVFWWSWCLDDGGEFDGFVPSEELSAADAKAAPTLVAVGLWENAESGYRFHDFNIYNPTKEQVMHKRESDRNRQNRLRESQRESQRDTDRDTDRESRTESFPARVPLPIPAPSHPRPDPTITPPTREAAAGSYPRAIQIWCEESGDLADFSKVRLSEKKHHNGAMHVLAATGGNEDEIRRLSRNFWAGQWNRDTLPGFPYFAADLSKWEKPPKKKHASAPGVDDYTDEDWGIKPVEAGNA